MVNIVKINGKNGIFFLQTLLESWSCRKVPKHHISCHVRWLEQASSHLYLWTSLPRTPCLFTFCYCNLLPMILFNYNSMSKDICAGNETRNHIHEQFQLSVLCVMIKTTVNEWTNECGQIWDGETAHTFFTVRLLKRTLQNSFTE